MIRSEHNFVHQNEVTPIMSVVRGVEVEIAQTIGIWHVPEPPDQIGSSTLNVLKGSNVAFERRTNSLYVSL